ncbi:MAG: hypothetical protein KGJ55_01095 [Gammaproteobacteria bacterium]|nr:hypothetical protein [Gammaproteobacteria bacterium]
MNLPAPAAPAPLLLELRPRPSMRGLRGLMWLHAVPAAGIPLLVIDGIPALVLAAGIAASWLYCRRHAAFGFGATAITGLRLYADGSWQIADARGWSAARLMSGSVLFGVWPMLCFVLNDGRRRCRVLVGDELETGALRRLRAQLLQLRVHGRQVES